MATGTELELPPGAARHVQVLRLQPGDTLTLFDGGPGPGRSGGEFDATVVRMGRSDVVVRVGAHHATEREAPRAIHLLAGITANERMDWLIEKATELGVASITPLVAERSVLKLKGERADKKIAHWQAVAVAACEQCGRNQVPVVHPAVDLAGWVRAHSASASAAVGAHGAGESLARLDAGAGADAGAAQRLVLSLRTGTTALRTAAALGTGHGAVCFLSGPEGGLSPAEEDLALLHGFAPTTLGPRILRAETAPLAALAALTLSML